MYAIKLELKLNNKERTLMARHSGYARFCYNYALSLYQEVKSLPGGSSKKVAAIERVFTNHIKKMPEYQWTNTLSSRVYKMTFRHFNEALSRFFKGLGEFPKFKRKKDGDSFTVDAADWNHSILLAAKKSIKIPNLGTFRLKESIPFPCVAQTFTLSRTADKWYVSFALKAENIPRLFHPVAEPVGIDLGVSTFATLSDGNSYESPRPLKKAKTKLSKEQWRNRQKQLGNRRLGVKASKNAHKHYRRIAKIYVKTANKPRDFWQKTLSRCSEKVRLAQSEVTPVDKKGPTPLVEAGSERQICHEVDLSRFHGAVGYI